MAEVGCDVSQEWVDIAVLGKVKRVERGKRALLQVFSEVPPGSRVLVEPTGRYHRLVVECARRAGHDVKVVDPYAFSLYRRSLKPRVSTDKICALALARFAEKEWDRLPEYKPLPKHLQRLKDLLELRETQTTLRVALQQAIGDIKRVPASTQRAVRGLERAAKDLEAEVFALVQNDPLYHAFLAMDGVGPVIAPALVWLFRAFSFENSDQAVAFAGIDVRVRESGKFVGMRKLTKRGSPLLRKLLHCSASSLRKIEHFKPLFAKHHARGRGVTAVNIIVGRKLLRAAFEIACHGARYDRLRFYSP